MEPAGTDTQTERAKEVCDMIGGRRNLACMLVLVIGVLASAGPALAVSADSWGGGTTEADELGASIYDIVVNRMLKGPIGLVGGVAMIVLGAIQAARNNLMGAVPAVVAGGVLLKAEEVVGALGAVI